MSSRQEQRVSSAEGEAHERTERARVVGAGGHEERHRAGILESVQQGARSLVSAVGRTLGVATKDKVGEYKQDYSVDKQASQAGDATAHKASETAEATAGKLGAADKASHAGDVTAQKASEASGATKDKAAAMKDATAQKGSETATNRVGEYRDSAAHAAKETKDATAEKTTKQSTEELSLSKAARDDGSPEESARKAMEYLTLRREEVKEEQSGEEVSRQEQVAEGERRWKDGM